MIDKEDWEIRRRQWEAFNQWEAAQDPDPHPSGDALADVGAIYEWLPEDVRHSDADPEKLGIRRMRAILALLSQRR